MITIHLPIVPPKTTHQAKKIVTIGKGDKSFTKLADKPELTKTINDYMSLLRPHAPRTPMTGAVRLEIEFVFPWRKSEPKRNRLLGKIPKTTKPDCSNMLKTIEDVMTKLGFWNDDAQVFAPHPSKYWGNKVGITIRIEEVR